PSACPRRSRPSTSGGAAGFARASFGRRGYWSCGRQIGTWPCACSFPVLPCTFGFTSLTNEVAGPGQESPIFFGWPFARAHFRSATAAGHRSTHGESRLHERGDRLRLGRGHGRVHLTVPPVVVKVEYHSNGPRGAKAIGALASCSSATWHRNLALIVFLPGG